jgi:peptidase E
MNAVVPTILATSGGYSSGERIELSFSPLIRHAVELSGVEGRRPRLAHLGTACGDQRWLNAWVSEAAYEAGYEMVHVNFFPMPPTGDVEGLLSEQDVVWVNGGSVANLLAVWRVHDLGPIMRRVWERGVVLAGVSAGSICWHLGGPTDSFGPELRIVTDGLGMLPYGNGVHYDAEPGRRPAVHAAVADGTLPLTYCTDNGAGLVYRGTELLEVVTDRADAAGYVVHRDGDKAVEERLPARLLR